MTPEAMLAVPTWWMTLLGWRASRLLTRRRVDVALRARSAAGLPISRARFQAMGLPNDAIVAALHRVRSLADWDVAWIGVAQMLLAESRRHGSEGRAHEAALAQQHAALCYHAAHLFVFDDPKKMRALRATATTLYAQTVPTLMPTVTRAETVWRTALLPGYLARPRVGPRPAPLAVMLNGVTTAKEETLLWMMPLLAQGIAVLAIDWPGTGEAGQTLAVTANCDDITDGIVAHARDDAGLDATRIALCGVSLGGSLAVRCAALDRRIAAAVAVTPPYNAERWLPFANPLLIEQLTALSGGRATVDALAAGFALDSITERLRCPLLAVGAGHDLMVPPAESRRLCADIPELSTLIWYPTAGHGAYEVVDDWATTAARWLRAILSDDGAESTLVDDRDSTRATHYVNVVDESMSPAEPGRTLNSY